MDGSRIQSLLCHSTLSSYVPPSLDPLDLFPVWLFSVARWVFVCLVGQVQESLAATQRKIWHRLESMGRSMEQQLKETQRRSDQVEKLEEVQKEVGMRKAGGSALFCFLFLCVSVCLEVRSWSLQLPPTPGRHALARCSRTAGRFWNSNTASSRPLRTPLSSTVHCRTISSALSRKRCRA